MKCDNLHILYKGTGQSNEFQCPAGTYYDASGNVRIQNCIKCTPGHYCPPGSVLPLACLSGTYSSIPGARVRIMIRQEFTVQARVTAQARDFKN